MTSSDGVESGADMSPEDYERLALDMLSVEAGDVAEVKNAMRKIIASAPDGADVAFLLSRALAHAGDRVLTSAVPLHETGEWGSAVLDRSPSRWWVAAVVPFLGAAAMFWWLGDIRLQVPGNGNDAAGMEAMSMFVMSISSLGAALLGIETVFLLRWLAPGPVALTSSEVCPPGWYMDPWGQGTTRWWTGSRWTGRLTA